MNFSIYTGPRGGLLLEELLRRTPLGTGALCAVVPDHRSRIEFERILAARFGGGVMGARVHTFDGLARTIVSLDAPAPSIIPRHLRQALIMEVLRSRVGRQSPFATIAGTPGFIRLAASWLDDLRSSRDIPLQSPELEAVRRAYESHLHRLGMTDHEGMVLAALENDRPRRFATTFTGPLIVHGFYDLTPRQEELLLALAGVFHRSAMTLIADASRPGLCTLPLRLLGRLHEAGARSVLVEEGDCDHPEASPVATVSAVLAGFGGGKYPAKGYPDAVRVHTFRSIRDESLWVASMVRDLVGGGTCVAGDVMVVSRTRPEYDHPLTLAFRRAGIPLEGGASRPLASHLLVRLVLAAIEAAVSPTDDRIDSVQRSSWVSLEAGLRGRDERGWSALIAEADTPAGFIQSTHRLMGLLGIAETLRDAGERAVFERFTESLDEWAVFQAPFRPMLRAAEYLSLLRSFTGAIPLDEDPAVGEGVILAGVAQARFIERPVVICTGLTNDVFPMAERRFSLHAKGPAAFFRERREAEEGMLFFSAIAGAHRLILTAPGADDEGQSDALSPWLIEIADGIAPWSPMIDHPRISGEDGGDGFTTRRGMIERAVRLLRQPSKQQSDSIAEFPDSSISGAARYAIGRYRELRRKAGFVLEGGSTAEDTGWGHDRIVPVTALECYRECPVRFFLIHILGLDEERPLRRGFDPAERGALAHQILAAFYRARKLRNGHAAFFPAELPEARRLLESITAEVFADANHRRRIHPQLLAVERRVLIRQIGAFLDVEAAVFAGRSIEPALFEVSFGSGGVPPLVLGDENHPLFVGGRIDRIDRMVIEGGEALRVVDYKTGKAPEAKDLRDGIALQVPLYLAAAGLIIPDVPPVEGVYSSLADARYTDGRGLAGCRVIDGDIDTAIDTAVRAALEAAMGVREGLFPPPSDGKHCERCGWVSVCRGGWSVDEEEADAALQS